MKRSVSELGLTRSLLTPVVRNKLRNRNRRHLFIYIFSGLKDQGKEREKKKEKEVCRFLSKCGPYTHYVVVSVFACLYFAIVSFERLLFCFSFPPNIYNDEYNLFCCFCRPPL